MNLPAPISQKISKLLPLLGSDKDGEVLGAARAICRALASAGQDLHDLAARLTARRPTPEPHTYGPRPSSGPWRWHRLSTGEKIIALDGISALALSPWERTFVASIATRMRHSPYASLSPRQTAILDSLLRRAWEEEQQ